MGWNMCLGKVSYVWILCVGVLLGRSVLGSNGSHLIHNNCVTCSFEQSVQYILTLTEAYPASRCLNVAEDLLENFTHDHNLSISPVVSFGAFVIRSNIVLVKVSDTDPIAKDFILWAKGLRRDIIYSVTLDRSIRYRPQQVQSQYHTGSAIGLYEYEELVDGFKKLHSTGATGSNVRVAVFDTGLTPGPWTCKNLREVTVWTGDDSESFDRNGHGTAVAGVLCSPNELCPGLAPNIDLLVFKLYSETSEAMTSWFIGALDYAMHHDVDLINLSIGGPDFLDEVFTAKIRQAVAQGITVVSAVGNDGPMFGTAHNPADMTHVVAVGSVDAQGKVAEYSSRGMTAWELQTGMGRVKPDVVAFSHALPVNSKPPTFARLFPELWVGRDTCTTMSGTSIAAPIVTSALAVALSRLHQQERRTKGNPGLLKQCIQSTSIKIPETSIHAQGAGKLDAMALARCLQTAPPSVTTIPAKLDLSDCYLFPYCTQPQYATSQPLVINVTLVSSIAVRCRILSTPKLLHGKDVNVSFTWSNELYPWVGWLGIHLRTQRSIAGIVRDRVQVRVECGKVVKLLDIPIMAKVVPPPARHRRLLWDQFHQLYFPYEYIPSDILRPKKRMRFSSFTHTQVAGLMDWPADHLFTTYLSMFNKLRDAGYYIEVLNQPVTAFDAWKYGALLIMDPERNYTEQEAAKLSNDVRDLGLGLVVAAGWYSEKIQRSLRFYDEVEKRWQVPATGGSNVPRYVSYFKSSGVTKSTRSSINNILSTFGIAFCTDCVYSGRIHYSNDTTVVFNCGTVLQRFPPEAKVSYARLWPFASRGGETKGSGRTVPFIVRLRVPGSGSGSGLTGGVAAMGDASCLEGREVTCLSLLYSSIQFATMQDELAGPFLY